MGRGGTLPLHFTTFINFNYYSKKLLNSSSDITSFFINSCAILSNLSIFCVKICWAFTYATSTNLLISAPTSSSRFFPYNCSSYGSSTFNEIGPISELIPYIVTISLAIFVATSKSLLAPVDISSKAILEKEFKIDTRGYRLKEVDQYLDLIISDYDKFFQILKEKEKEKEELLDEIMALKQEIRNLKTSLEIAKGSEEDESSVKSVSNVDIMKRLSQLEKIVYGKDE